MSDIFTVTASVVALGASILSGPVGPIDARPALDLHDTTNRGVVAVAYHDGELAGTIGRMSPSASYDYFPPLFFEALKAAEDGSFDKHMGVDPAGIARAGIDLLRNRLSGAPPGVGGSTLTQQLAKNVVTGSSRNIARKLADMISAVETGSVASKKEILESYANAVYFGRGSHGAKEAAQNWFGKDWDKLDLGEIAFLAGIVQAPSALDPLKHPQAARTRRDYVLDRMADEGVISKEKAAAAKAEPIDVVKPDHHDDGPDVAMSDADFWALSFARRELAQEGVNPEVGSGGDGANQALVLPLESKAQAIVQADLKKGLADLQATVGDVPLGTVLDKNIEDFSDPAVVTDAARAIAPHIPKDAVRVVIGPDKAGGRPELITADDTASVQAALKDVKVPKDAKPGDVYVLLPGEKRLAGRPRLQGAVVAIDLNSGKVIASVGGVRSWASQFDRTQALRQPGSAVKPYLYLAALEQGYSPTEMISDAPVSMDVDGMDGDDVWSPDNYEGEGTGGDVPLYIGLEKSLNRVAARLVMQIGSPSFQRVLVAAGAYPPNDDRLLLPSAALGTVETSPDRMAHAVAALDPQRSTIADPLLLDEIQKMMRGVVVRGTAAYAFRNGPDGVVGKTGTSQEDRDAWFTGRTGDIAMAVWVGRDDDEPLPRLHGAAATGGIAAAPICAQIIKDMRKAGISTEKIDATPFEGEGVAYGGPPGSPNYYPPAPQGPGGPGAVYVGRAQGQYGGNGNLMPWPPRAGYGGGRPPRYTNGVGLY